GAWWVPFTAMSNAWDRADDRPFDEAKKRTRGNFKEAIPVRFVESVHYPRYYFADQVVTIKDRHDFVSKLSTSTYSAATAFIPQPSFVPARGVIRRAAETANGTSLD